MTLRGGEVGAPSPSTHSKQAEEQLRFILESYLRYQRLVNLACSLAVFASIGALAYLLNFGASTPQPSTEVVSEFALVAIVILVALLARYLTSHDIRERAAFYRRLLPLATGYAYGSFLETAAVLNNSLVVSHFKIGGGRYGGAEYGLLFESFLGEDHSVELPSVAELNEWRGPFSFERNLRRIRWRGDPLRDEIEELRKRLGSLQVRTRVTELPTPTGDRAGRPRWHASAQFYNNRWYTQADRVFQTAEEILNFLKALLPAEVPR